MRQKEEKIREKEEKIREKEEKIREKEENIREKEETTRQTLAAIPSIFRTLHVTVLLPGSLCGCLRKAFDECQAAKAEVDEQEASADLPSEASAGLATCMKRLEGCLNGTDCLNSNGACSWTKRQWTLQEFLYSKSCSVLFANQEVMECLNWDTPTLLQGVVPEQLNDYTRLWYEDLVKRRSLGGDFWRFLLQENMYSSVSLYLLVTSKVRDNAYLRQASLLLGDRQLWDVTDEQDLLPFMTSLSTIANEPRTATQAADYILSTFPAVDGYVVPRKCSDLSRIELLEDALAQLLELKKWFIPNLSPMGLSGSIGPSAQWSPDISRAATEIRDSTDIYGSFLFSTPFKVRSLARLPLRLQSTRTIMSLGQNAQDFDTWVGGLNISKAIAHFTEMLVRHARRWFPFAERLQDRFGMSTANGTEKLYSSSESERVTGLIWLVSWISMDLVKGEFKEILNIVRKKTDFVSPSISIRVLEKAIHVLICEFLHLDATRCRENGVRAIFSWWHGVVQPGGDEEGMPSQSCVGLVNGQSFDQARSCGAELLTIGHHWAPEKPLYEAVRVPGTFPPEYRIIGAWVPLKEGLKVAEVLATMVHE
jgi:hypothetical protein